MYSAKLSQSPLGTLVRLFQISIGDAPRNVAFSFFRLHHAKRETLIVVFPVVNVAEIYFVFAGKEEFVRRREDRERSVSGIQNFETIAGSQIDRFDCWTAPPNAYCCHCRAVSRQTSFVSFSMAEAFQTGFIDIRDGGLIGLATASWPQEVRSFIGRKFHIARKQAQGQTVKRHTDASATGGYSDNYGNCS